MIKQQDPNEVLRLLIDCVDNHLGMQEMVLAAPQVIRRLKARRITFVLLATLLGQIPKIASDDEAEGALETALTSLLEGGAA